MASSTHPKRNANSPTTEERAFRATCAAYLENRWLEVTQAFTASAPMQPADPLADRPDLIALIRACLVSKSKSYHYVLPTHLLAKCVNPQLDSHCIQVSYGVPGAFDARSLAHAVIVPFDQTNFAVLGGSSEPYANNPLRIPAVTSAYRNAQKQQQDWDRLVAVFDAVEAANDEDFVRRAFDQVLFAIYRLLADVQVVYPTPNRISLDATYSLIGHYLDSKSGGERMEAVTTALFRTMAERFDIFDEVRREQVNAADQSSGMAGDIECWADGRIVLLVEVKDRTLTLVQLSAKLDRARSQQIKEILFVAQQGAELAETDRIMARIASEFVSGQNIYVARFNDFALGVLILMGEEGRVEFLRHVGKELDRANSAIQHRRAWADLLRAV